MEAPNTKQNDRTYGLNLSDIREKGYSEKSKFSASTMVSAGVYKLGKTSIHFVTPGAKINSVYYYNEVLLQLLPEMSNYQRMTISSNKMELVHTHQKLQLIN